MRGPRLTVYPKGVLLETYRRRLIALRDDGFNDDFMAALEEVHRQLEKHDALAARLAESEAECLEQARLNGMGSEREARLIARLAKAERLLREVAGGTYWLRQPFFDDLDRFLRTTDSAPAAPTVTSSPADVVMVGPGQASVDLSAPAVCRHGNGPLCGVCEAEMMAGTDDSADVCDWCGGTRVLADSDGRNECPCPECTTPTADEVKS